MKQAPEGIIEKIMIHGPGWCGHGFMLISPSGDVDCEYACGQWPVGFPERARWKKVFWLEFIKHGWVWTHFRITERVFGTHYTLLVKKPFGRMLVHLINQQQGLAHQYETENPDLFDEEDDT